MELVALALGAAAAGFGYLKARQFVRRRLRFVEAIHKPISPLVAGLAAALVAAPVVWLLPIVGGGTAVLFGVGVGLGAAHGARDARRLPGGRD